MGYTIIPGHGKVYDGQRYTTVIPGHGKVTMTNYCAPNRSPYERTQAAVYATGNKWAIENFNATHG